METIPYKLQQYVLTKEQCRVIKVNPAIIQNNVDLPRFGTMLYPLTVDIKIIRETLGIKYSVIINDISPYDLIDWNERMNPTRSVSFTTRKRQARTVVYTQTIN